MLLQARDKLNKNVHSGAKLIASQIVRYEVHYSNNKTGSMLSLDSLGKI